MKCAGSQTLGGGIVSYAQFTVGAGSKLGGKSSDATDFWTMTEERVMTNTVDGTK